MHEFEWFVERLELAKWEDESPGRRSGFFACPVHGGSDSLHLTEKNGKALVHCFGCEAGYTEVTEALEAEPIVATPAKRTRGREGDAEAPAGARTTPKRTRGSTPRRLHQPSPLDWMAQRLGLTRAELDELGLPLSETKDAVVFEFPSGAQKIRKAADGKRKDFAWSGEESPPLWPVPESPSEEIALTEGEMDAVALIKSGIDAYSVTKGSQGALPQAACEALYALGVRTAHLCFDLDDAGRKGRDAAVEALRAAGIDARRSRVRGIMPLLGEKDARSVALRQGYDLELEDDADEDDATPLSEVDATDALPLLLGEDRPHPGVLHPTEHTILFGDGGVGKGVIASWWAARLAKLGMRVLIIDYEQHVQHEWRPRIGKFLNGSAKSAKTLDRVMVVQPRKPVWDVEDWMKTVIARHQIDYVIIDSVAYACAPLEAEKSSTAAKYTTSVARFGKPVLSIAHVTKEDQDPRWPFGSIFWSNGARVTIGVSLEDPSQPDSTRLVKNRKTNQRGGFRTFGLKWDWLSGELPSDLDVVEAVASKQDRVLEVYPELERQLGRRPTCKELGGAVGETVSTVERARAESRMGIVVKRGKRDAGDDPDAAGED